MNPLAWALAIAVLCSCVFAVLWLSGRKYRRRLRDFLSQQESDNTPYLSEESQDGLSDSRKNIIIKLKMKYDGIARFLKIPPDAAVVPVNTEIFGLKKREIMHYIWATQPNLYMFPVWDDVVRYFYPSSEFFSYREGDENNISTIAIPKSRIEFWRALQSGGVEIFYTNAENERVDLILRSVPAEPFRAMLAEQEETYIIERIYPKSSKNIFDIKDEFTGLKARWESGELSKEEFDREKMIILLTM